MGSSRPVLPENRKHFWTPGPRPGALVDRFWPKVYKPSRTEDSCWLWMATRDQYGYGLIGYQRGVIRAHRASWILAHGHVPDGLQVLHRCDNPPCVNPAHLWLGSHTDNMRDASRKGRLKRWGSKEATA